MRRLPWAAFAAATLILFSAGCGGGGDDDSPPPSPPAARGSIDGVVLDAATGSVIAGAVVKAGAESATSGADGRYVLQAGPTDRLVLNVAAAGYAEGLSIASVTENGTATLVTKLLPVGSTTTISNATGGTAGIPGSTAQVILPAGAFGAADQVRIDLTAVNPAQDPTQMPGDFVTNTGQRIETAGALIITARDANGATLQLAAGQSATIRIPLSTRGTATPTMPLFFLNPQTGNWEQEGTATLMGTAPNQFYEGTVTHFSTWNADQVYDTITVRGCVQDKDGARAAGVLVTSDGIDYSGTASATTDSNGNFAVAMKKNARAAITGIQGRGLLSNSVSVGPSASDISVSACLMLTDAINAITIRLTWGEIPTDVDSYLFTPSGARIDYTDQGSLTSEPFANLDVDDVDSFGPEVVTITRLMVGTYMYGLHNFSGESNPGMTSSPVRVELNTGGRVQVFTLPAGETPNTDFVRLFNITVDARCNITVAAVNIWQSGIPAAPAPTAPTYCTP